MLRDGAIVSNNENDNDVNDPAINPHQRMIHRIPPQAGHFFQRIFYGEGY